MWLSRNSGSTECSFESCCSIITTIPYTSLYTLSLATYSINLYWQADQALLRAVTHPVPRLESRHIFTHVISILTRQLCSPQKSAYSPAILVTRFPRHSDTVPTNKRRQNNPPTPELCKIWSRSRKPGPFLTLSTCRCGGSGQWNVKILTRMDTVVSCRPPLCSYIWSPRVKNVSHPSHIFHLLSAIIPKSCQNGCPRHAEDTIWESCRAISWVSADVLFYENITERCYTPVGRPQQNNNGGSCYFDTNRILIVE